MIDSVILSLLPGNNLGSRIGGSTALCDPRFHNTGAAYTGDTLEIACVVCLAYRMCNLTLPLVGSFIDRAIMLLWPIKSNGRQEQLDSNNNWTA